VLQQIRDWYNNRTRGTKKKRRDVPPISLARKQKKKPVPLSLYQGYSQLFCKPGSDLHKQVCAEYTSYISGDPAAVSKYSNLFTKRPENAKPIKFVTFQQVIMRQLVADATEEELAEVKQYVETRHKEVIAARERPWESLDGELESEKQERYISA